MNMFEEMTTEPRQFDANQQSERLFFALYPPPEQAAQADVLGGSAKTRHRLDGKQMPQSRMHITLVLPGKGQRLRAPYEISLDRAAAAVRLPPIDIVLDHSLGFGTRDSNYFVLGASKETTLQLRHLKDALGAGLQAQGISAPKNSNFTPHLTLFYGTSACLPPEEIAPIRWRADRFVLIRSLIGQGRHIVEGEWLLEADPG